MSITQLIYELALKSALSEYANAQQFIAIIGVPADKFDTDISEELWMRAGKKVLTDILERKPPVETKPENADDLYIPDGSDADDFVSRRGDFREVSAYDLCKCQFIDVEKDKKKKRGETKQNGLFEYVKFGYKYTIILVCNRDFDDVITKPESAIADVFLQITDLSEYVKPAISDYADIDISDEEAALFSTFSVKIQDAVFSTKSDLHETLKRLSTAHTMADVAKPAKPIKIQKDDGLRIEDAVGYGQAKAWALDLIQDLDDYRNGLIEWSDIDRGILISGAPGTGKTTFAAALARSAGCNFVHGSYSKWQSRGHQGDMLKALYSAFEDAKNNAPAILLIDEIDCFLDRERSDDSFNHNADYNRGCVNGLLECLDGSLDREGVIVIGACNNPNIVDNAVRRSGRLDRHIEIKMPDANARSHILQYHLKSDLDVSSVIAKTAGMSGADLERIAREARRLARRQRTEVSLEHIMYVLPEVTSEASETPFLKVVH